jgi:hypothetical protein
VLKPAIQYISTIERLVDDAEINPYVTPDWELDNYHSERFEMTGTNPRRTGSAVGGIE